MIDFIINHLIISGIGWIGISLVLGIIFGKFCVVGRGGAND